MSDSTKQKPLDGEMIAMSIIASAGDECPVSPCPGPFYDQYAGRGTDSGNYHTV